MPAKSFDVTSGRFLVEFRLPPESGAPAAWLAGEFNGWSTDACPMERDEDGSLKVVVPLEPGRSYRFRYYLGDGEWENDWAADAYVGNEHGGSDSVVVVPDAVTAPPTTAVDGSEVADGSAVVRAGAREEQPYPSRRA